MPTIVNFGITFLLCGPNSVYSIGMITNSSNILYDKFVHMQEVILLDKILPWRASLTQVNFAWAYYELFGRRVATVRLLFLALHTIDLSYAGVLVIEGVI